MVVRWLVGGGGDDGGRDDDGEVAAEVHGAQGAPSVHDGAHAMGDGCGDRVHGCAGAEGYGGEGGGVEGGESGGDEAVGEVDVGEVEREVGRAVEAVVEPAVRP